MPIVNGAYVAPTWNNDAPPAINAAELQDICDTIETYDTSKANVSYVNTFVRPNLLDNWYFVGGGSQQGNGQFPINQRGATSYSGAVYGIDMWRALASGITVTIGSDSITVSSTSNTHSLCQRIGSSMLNNLAGKTVTFSVLTGSVSGNVYLSDIGGLASNHDDVLISANSITSYTFKVNGNATASSCGPIIWFLANASANLIAAKLEIGNTQTLAHWNEAAQEWVLNEVPNYQQELAKCQRHLVKLNMTNSIYPTFGGNVAANSGFVYITIELPEEMRTAPAIVLSNAVDTYYVTDGLTNFNLSSMTLDRFMGDRVKIACRTTGLTPGQFYSLEAVSAESIIFTT